MPSIAQPAMQPSSRILLGLVALGAFMHMLDATSVNTALPSIAQEFNVNPLSMRWVMVAFMLTSAMVLPATGWLADRFGTRRVYALAVLLFISGSTLCALAPNLNILIAGRIVQGGAHAMLLPVGRLAVLRTFPKEQFLAALSMVMIPALVGQVIGPTLGGLLVQYLSWHWVFLINLPIGIACLVATLIAMPDARQPTPHRFDLTGYVLLAITMVTISLALDGFARTRQQPTSTLLLLALGVSACISYIVHARRVAHPLFTRALFKNRSFNTCIIGNIFARIGSGSMPFMLPLFMQVGLGYSPAKAGMMLLPMAFSAIFAKRVVTWLIYHYGYRHILILNTLVVGACIASFSLMSNQLPVWVCLLMFACLGAANSIQFTAMSTGTLKSLDTTTASSGNTLLSMAQILSMSVGISVASIILGASSRLLADNILSPTSLAAFHWTFLIIGILMTSAALIFRRLPDDRPAPQTVP